MDPSSNAPPPLSQESSHFPVEPLPASLLVDRELDRRERPLRKGNLMTGCGELDDYVLMGGLERGCVVGVSAEEEEMGLSIGLQTVAHLLATNMSARTMVVTTLPASVLLPKLRKALVGQLSVLQDGLKDLQKKVHWCLERTSIARVFDIEGLWEVLGELEATVSMTDSGPPQVEQEWKAVQKPDEAPPAEHTKGQRGQRTEVLDSEDEGGLSSPESSPPQKPPAQPDTQSNPRSHPPDTGPSPLPDLILITHTSTLLNTLFTGRDKEAAHNTMLLLSSHLHSLTRSPSHGGPLIMFLNSTTSPSSSSFSHHTAGGPTAPPTDRQNHVEPTLRSIFNIPPPTVAGHQQVVHNFTAARRNKPSFGSVFAQMLDLHLLCTRVPRTRADSAVLMDKADSGVVVAGVSYVWVVEVLLDEVGVYERSDAGWDWGRRRCREQRWGAVDVDGEGRVVGAPLS